MYILKKSSLLLQQIRRFITEEEKFACDRKLTATRKQKIPAIRKVIFRRIFPTRNKQGKIHIPRNLRRREKSLSIRAKYNFSKSGAQGAHHIMFSVEEI